MRRMEQGGWESEEAKVQDVMQSAGTAATCMHSDFLFNFVAFCIIEACIIDDALGQHTVLFLAVLVSGWLTGETSHRHSPPQSHSQSCHGVFFLLFWGC